ncbi:hypothetical protein EVAR_49315_1 [Eumeta japonica]|uniref:Uncharacterized protein n=1 Tax=Eumeta variegata TaxID=151549 RepID=A0A4C1YB88_EUMVA|nr:hypothetical protein EVAR_49315_1 [Eumeta japonica]
MTVTAFLMINSVQSNEYALPRSLFWYKCQKPLFEENVAGTRFPEFFKIETPHFFNYMSFNRQTYSGDAPNPVNFLNLLPKFIFGPTPVETDLSNNEVKDRINTDDLSNEIDSKEYTTEESYTETTIADYDTSTIDEDIMIRVGEPAAVVASLLG